MIAPLAEIVDVDALLEVVWASLAAGIGVTVAFSLAILGVTRFADLRGQSRAGEAAIYALLAVLGAAAVAAAVVFGIVVMTSK